MLPGPPVPQCSDLRLPKEVQFVNADHPLKKKQKNKNFKFLGEKALKTGLKNQDIIAAN